MHTPLSHRRPFMDLLAKAVTLKSIRLFDKEAKELLFSAKHAVLYRFSQESGWTKTDTEGCLAVYLTTQLSPHLTILNRLQPENFSCSLAKVGEVELEGELLMFKASSGIMGIWLFDANELQSLYQLILSQRSATRNGSSANTTANSTPSSSTSSSTTTTTTTRKSISLNELLSQPSSKNNTCSLEEQLRSEFAEHSFGDLKEFARAVARFITLNPSSVSSLFEDLRK